ncbi:dipeptidase [Deinococcus humi]|uniref:Acetylornithine deacetylase/succinyl-diaminopimelate desuccinylase-like protein n=1 Tax=Deinococcus humi TaxID=662880 RepID=A0A7W8JX75_9DEIO|nr:dipeptidase [Deinococcus humi]MBB5364911.1 acetylornithine deacetylase/succinyl-diaminopimelate desuccinylase-like protein [Deinococcus humi]GGO33689.1 peptidase M20 [Deinococcus humi]
MSGLSEVLARLDQCAATSLSELIEFASIPSVSAQPAHQADMERAAGWLMERFKRAGLQTVERWPTAGHAAVYAEYLGAGEDAPTLLVYGHYDVQPPDPLEKWHTPPFTPTVRGERIYGRGVSDDKGPLLLTVQVLDAYLSTLGRLPLNLKFLFEGEEEMGSAHLNELVAQNAGRLGADFVLSADGGMWSASVPSLTVSARGLAALELTLRGASKDLHSGRHGGSVHNPLHALASLIAGLHNESGRVTVPGFYDGVADLTPQQREGIRQLPFSDEAYLNQTGAPAVYGEVGYSTLERQWHRPTLEVNGLWGGYTGEGSKTVLPAEAHAKITCRLVPGQEPERIAQLLRTHLERRLPPGITLQIHSSDHGARAYRLPDDHPGAAVAREVLAELYGKPPLDVGMGGSIPVLETFQSVLGLDTVFFSFAVGDEDIHAPNEFFRVPRLYEGQKAWAQFWWKLGQQKLAERRPS